MRPLSQNIKAFEEHWIRKELVNILIWRALAEDAAIEASFASCGIDRDGSVGRRRKGPSSWTSKGQMKAIAAFFYPSFARTNVHSILRFSGPNVDIHSFQTLHILRGLMEVVHSIHFFFIFL